MNCSSTHLTFDPTRVMFLTWQQPDSTAAALNKFCSICTPNGVYTEFGIDPIPDDYRLSIDRECSHFKRTYALRTECERYNSRFKASGQERLWVRNATSAANLNTLAHISALAVACAAVLSSPRHSCRSPKSLRRTA